MPSLKERIADFLLAGAYSKAKQAAISVTVDDSKGWDQLSGGGPHDRPWSELRDDLDDALEAWRKNFMIRRVVNLIRSYVVGNGITIASNHREVEGFIRDFWDHPMNRMDERLGPICDELIRSGEVFTALFTNKADGMSYVRFVPASRIREVETDPEDYEKELRYGQIQETSSELKWWISPDHPDAKRKRPFHPVMYHFAINKPIGATRGESDFSTILKWALRYSSWLEDRVRLNRTRTRQGMLDVKIEDDSQVEAKKYQLRRDDPMTAGIYVHGPGETTTLHNLQIRADDSEADGKALRLAIAAGSGVALHYMGEGAEVNYATAREMGEPTSRFFNERQQYMVTYLLDLIAVAHARYLLATGRRAPAKGDLKLQASTPEVARADNESLASALNAGATALATMRQMGWTDDLTAAQLAFKFAGETFSEEEIAAILEAATPFRDPGGHDTGDVDVDANASEDAEQPDDQEN